MKTGWTFTANLFGAIFGFAILKACSTTFAKNFPILGGDFGPKENAIVQTAATAAGGMGGIFVSAIPAMYQLNLLGEGPQQDFGRLLTFTIVSAYYGLFFATPRKSPESREDTNANPPQSASFSLFTLLVNCA